MVSKKICMLGAFSVGKTSLVAQYVHSVFSDKYLSTVGVKISKKNIKIGDIDVTMVLWDMEGKDDYAEVNMSYLRGAMGFFVVADGTRKETLEMGMTIREQALQKVPGVPNYFLINKADIADQWEITPSMLEAAETQGVKFIKTSAKTGLGVEEAFSALATKMLGT